MPGFDGKKSLLAVAAMFTELGERLASAAKTGDVFTAVTDTALHRVTGADAASITTVRKGKFRTVAATDERARLADAVQYQLRSGPCIDAVLQGTLYYPNDLCRDERWPDYGRRVNAELGWVSMLSYRLSSALIDDEVLAALNIYSEHRAAFDEDALRMGLLLATHGALAVAADTHRERAENLQRALHTSREIGVAVGILMTAHTLTREQAFDLLRIASQNTNRKLSDIAVDVADTGTLTVVWPTGQLDRKLDPLPPPGRE